jgi:hypothetical protein
MLELQNNLMLRSSVWCCAVMFRKWLENKRMEEVNILHPLKTFSFTFSVIILALGNLG